jgi:periplasmic divalent cation tolerance protein
MIVIYSTFPNESVAKKICKELLNERVCACVNIWPIRSMYSWKGKMQNKKEVAVFFKAKKESRAVLKARIKELHPYEVPAIIEITPSSVSEDYLLWVRKV